MRCEHLHDSAVYVLGALSPPDREAYERHLADCAECRAEVAEFGELPALLGLLEPEAVEALVAEDTAPAPGWAGPSVAPASSSPLPSSATSSSSSFSDASWAGPSAVPRWAGPSVVPSTAPSAAAEPLLPRVLDRAQRTRRTERRRRRWQSAGTALVAACLGILAVVGVRSAGVGGPDYVSMQEVASSVPVTASLALESVADGTLVRMQCAYKTSAAGYGKWTYKLFVVPKSGEAEELDSWTASLGDEYQLKAHSTIRRADIQKIEIRRGDGTPLLILNA